jgi:hypothetical protein
VSTKEGLEEKIRNGQSKGEGKKYSRGVRPPYAKRPPHPLAELPKLPRPSPPLPLSELPRYLVEPSCPDPLVAGLYSPPELILPLLSIDKGVLWPFLNSSCTLSSPRWAFI